MTLPTQDTLGFRRGLIAPLFEYARASESFAVVAPASIGKSRVTRFILRDDVQRHYLGRSSDGNGASTTRLVLCDFNRLADISEWGMHEVILTSLIESCAPAEREPLLPLQRDVITQRNDALLARRHVELALLILTREFGLKMCLLFDEFDELLRELPSSALNELRAMRDASKYWVSYGLFVRDRPDRLRAKLDFEGFYELFSRSILWLRPYESDDALEMIVNLEKRRQRTLTPEVRQTIIHLGGGHSGMMNALFDMLSLNFDAHAAENPAQLLNRALEDEARTLWDSLADDERQTLNRAVHGTFLNIDTAEVLVDKGLLQRQDDEFRIFSPVFEQFVRQHGFASSEPLVIDEKSGVVWVGATCHKDLTPQEFELLRFLYSAPGVVRSRDEIHKHLYPKDKAVAGNTVEAFIKRTRDKIEPDRKHPRYLITLRGRGYRLDTGG